jgi:hypothetical protein
MSSITEALENLQNYIDGASTPNATRRPMLSLHNIVATSTACVTTYSDLEFVVRDCVSVNRRMNRMKWLIIGSNVGELKHRLQEHKLSLMLMLMLMILQR